MQSLSVVALCTAAAVVFGVLHDQVTVRVCTEYFTVGHPPVFWTDDPTLLAFGWGVLATWWVGLILGVTLTVAARAGRRPPRSVRSLIRPVVQLMAFSATAALSAGLLGSVLAVSGAIVLVEPLATEVSRDKHVAFLANMWAHVASYLSGFVGGLFMCVRVWRSRRSLGQ